MFRARKIVASVFLAMLVAPVSLSQSPNSLPHCEADEILWDKPPNDAPACTCKDLGVLYQALESSNTYIDHYVAVSKEILDADPPLSLADSQTLFLQRHNAGPSNPKKGGASGDREFAWTEGDACYTCIRPSALTGACRELLLAAWDHESSHRDKCRDREAAGVTSASAPGFYHSDDEADAYRAGAKRLREAIFTILSGAKITFKWSLKNRYFAKNSHGEGMLIAESRNASDSFVLRGNGKITSEATRMGDCTITSKPFTGPFEVTAKLSNGRLEIESARDIDLFPVSLRKPCLDEMETTGVPSAEFDLANIKPFVFKGNVPGPTRIETEFTLSCPKP